MLLHVLKNVFRKTNRVRANLLRRNEITHTYTNLKLYIVKWLHLYYKLPIFIVCKICTIYYFEEMRHLTIITSIMNLQLYALFQFM